MNATRVKIRLPKDQDLTGKVIRAFIVGATGELGGHTDLVPDDNVEMYVNENQSVMISLVPAEVTDTTE